MSEPRTDKTTSGPARTSGSPEHADPADGTPERLLDPRDPEDLEELRRRYKRFREDIDRYVDPSVRDWPRT